MNQLNCTVAVYEVYYRCMQKINPTGLQTVLEVGQGEEAGWYPVSFQKTPKPSLCKIAKSSHHLFFSRFGTIPLLFFKQM
jgi:hypothetical protein